MLSNFKTTLYNLACKYSWVMVILVFVFLILQWTLLIQHALENQPERIEPSDAIESTSSTDEPKQTDGSGY